MSFNHDSEIDMDQAAAFLKDAVAKVKTEENPDLLNDLKKVYKQNVPLTLRMYVAAYLVKELQGGFHGSRFARKNDRSQHDTNRRPDNRAAQRDNRTARDAHAESQTTDEHSEDRTPRPRVQIDESVAATIFISIGRNRRVYPRDLVGLLTNVANLDRDRIGDIRVLANYSFVQLFKDDTEKAIAALNGYDYRGRKLAVSYSRQKDESAESDASAVPADNTAAPSAQEPAAAESQTEVDPQAAAEDAKAYAAAEKAASRNEPFSSGNNSTDGNFLV